MTMSTTNRSINKPVVYECIEKMYAKIMQIICLGAISKNFHFKKPRVYMFFLYYRYMYGFLNLKNQIGRVMAGHNMETMF